MSEILLLGTGAADWDIQHKGDFFRRNSAALVNNSLMVDCGEHIFDFAQSIGRQELYDRVTDIIITHRHRDHFCRESVLTMAQKQKIRVGCDGHIMNVIGDHPNIEFVRFKPFEERKMGEYKIIPLLANHDIVIDGDSCAFHYIIQTPDDKKIFYGLDGAWFLRPSWEEMKRHKFDIMIFDCTVGDIDDWRIFEHNTIPMLRTMIKEIKDKNLLNDGGRLVASHMARTLHGSHEETQNILKKIDVITAFDGMNIEL
ncbi:MAG: hypothetical protein IJ365_06190 [Clostridia bacterium]|nr:hypothetical protein [Clostridia bacterium]